MHSPQAKSAGNPERDNHDVVGRHARRQQTASYLYRQIESSGGSHWIDQLVWRPALLSARRHG
jgi:hypothetical protein